MIVVASVNKQLTIIYKHLIITKMKKINLFLILFSFLAITSCEINENENTLQSESFNLEEDVLSFKSSNELKTFVDGLKDESQSSLIIEKLKKSYDNGFVPLNPQSTDENLINKIVEKRKLSTNNENGLQSRLIEVEGEIYDVEDDLILDDEFASFLSANREIIVNDTLYTYTVKGTFKTHKSNLTLMRNYILDSDIQEYETLPTAGTYQTTDSRISLIVPISNPCSSNLTQSLSYEIAEFDTNSNNCYSGFYSGGSGSTGSSSGGSSTTVDHTQNLRDYVSTLTPCSSSNNLMGIFGPDRRCWSYFDSDRRTKTVFWKHNYLVYRSVGVKVKHQKKHRFGWWYASDDNSEIALLIDKAYFKMKPETNPINVHNHSLAKVILFDGKVYNNNAQLIGGATNLNFQLPNLPLNAQFTVSDFIHNTTGVSISPSQIKNIVYNQTWNQLVSILQSTLGQNQPKTLNYYLYDTALNEIHFMHINVEERRTNAKKIVKTFDFNMGITVKFNVYNSGSLSGPASVATSFSFPGLFKYKDADIDFVGASRRGSTWRGSKLVFTD